MKEMYFDFRDVFRAPRLALSLKKIWIHFVALVWGLLVYNILFYLGVFIVAIQQGYTFDLWAEITFGAANFGIFPCPFVGPYLLYFGDIFLAWFVWGVGLAFLLIYGFLARGAVAKITVEQLKGNDFYTRRESWRFVRKNWKAMIFAPVALVIILALMFAGGIILGLIASIPAVGQILATLFMFPFYAIGLFYVFLLGVFILSTFFSPVIVASTRNDVFETIFELYTTLSNQPWRLLTYEVLLKIISGIAVMLFTAVSFLGLNALFLSYSVVIADKMTLLLQKSIQFLPQLTILYKGVISNLFLGTFPTHFIPGSMGSFTPNGWSEVFINPAIWCGGTVTLPEYDITYKISVALLAITLNLVLAFIISYGLAIGSVGQTVTYIVLRKKKDDENLLERVDEDLEEIIPTEEATGGEVPATEAKPEETPPSS
jgi:hypothetical protein